MVVEGIVISAAIGLLTGGAGAVAGGSAVVAKVAAQSPRFAAILAALRSVAAASSAYLRTARASLRASRAKLGKFADARLAARTERGRSRSAVARPPGWLAAHEHSGGHTILKHVGKSVDELSPSGFRRRTLGQGVLAFPTQDDGREGDLALLARGTPDH